MGNDAIKDAILKHLEKNNLLTEEFYRGLINDTSKLKSLREDVDGGLLNLKKHIISSNLHLIIERIFKGDNEEVIKMLKGTHRRELFFDFTEEFNRFLILFEQYIQNIEFDSPDLEEIKGTFALTDQQLCELINEISLGNK